MRILVTGATGLVGSALATRLVELRHTVSGLARTGRTGLLPPGVHCVPGDVRLPMLTADAGDRSGYDVVVHCAAVTAFGQADSVYRAVNVEGTAHALAFARRAGARLIHVSTAYVCGDRDGDIAECAVGSGQSFTNGYEASKAAAERLVAEANGVIARPSIVTGAWADGSIASFGGFYTLFGLLGSGRIGVMPADPGAALDLVPIDHVVDGLVDMTERIDAAVGRVHHLVSGTPVPVTRLHGIAAADPRLRMPPLVRSGSAPFHGSMMRLYAGYLSRAPRFEAVNLKRLSGRVCPPVDDGYLRRLTDFAVGAGVFGASRMSG